MKNLNPFIIRALLFSLAISLIACQAPKDKTSGWTSASGEVRPGPDTGKAVLALLNKARQASKKGSLSTAESHLERALRIEPQNPTLWLYMAKLRLYAAKPQEAINLANSWRVIAHAKLKLNNPKAAQKAQDKANSLN